MSQHTRGPLNVGIWDDGRFQHHAVFPEAKNEAICLTGLVGEGGEEEERSIADAHLFSASPDMLKALEYIVNHCRIICDDSFDTIDGMATEDAIKAIRKAKGEA